MRDYVTVMEAARRLGVSESAIRKRVQRKQIEFQHDAKGRLQIVLDEPETERDEVVEDLRDQVRWLREELARRDAILMNMTEAVKALNPPAEEAPLESPTPPPDAPEGAEGAAESAPGTQYWPGEVEAQNGPERAEQYGRRMSDEYGRRSTDLGGAPGTPPSWWRRLFGG